MSATSVSARRISVSAVVRGGGVLGPGLDGWKQTLAMLGGDADWQAAPTRIPTPQILPAAERRRVGAVVKLALEVGLQAV
ncbi:MAG: hypothetical protein LBB76_11820, partial [Azoarcus sp.]|nr:hypothetical protein [Azoarcus sp.]